MVAASSPGDRDCGGVGGVGEGRREDGVREGLRMRNPNTGSQRSGSPAQGCHLPDGDFKDLIEFALEQRCLDTNRGK